MERLNCFICHQKITDELLGLKNHFINTHGLTPSRGVGDQGFKCGQHGCRRRFLNFSTLRRHIQKNHLRNESDDSDNEEIHAEDNYERSNNDDNFENYININNNENVNIDNNENGNDNDYNNILNNNQIFDVRRYVVRMIGRFQCKAFMTAITLSKIIDECEELLVNTCGFLRDKVNNFFIEENLTKNNEAQNILKAFDLSNVFDGLRKFDDQITALEQSSCQYIRPVEIPLGRRMDKKLDKTTGTYKPHSVMETFQYISIKDTLSLVISNPKVLEAILNEKKSPNGVLCSFLDGEHAETHEFLREYPHALRIQLYYDELEIVNPLGSKTGIHKLGAFYYSIQNLPPQINSELNSIHVLVLCTDVDVKKYGFKAILQPFLNDLKELESDEGILVDTENGPYILRATLTTFIGDGLAVHDVFNLLGPSCNQFCRMCMYSRTDLHAGSLELGQERTLNLYNQQIQLLITDNFSSQTQSATGIRGECCVHDSKYFHITRNKIFDPMHDFLCGICPMVIKLVLKQYVIVEKKFDIKYFNDNVTSFQWGFCENTNKPSANFTEFMQRKKDYLLTQKTMQIWCLIRALPAYVNPPIVQKASLEVALGLVWKLYEIVKSFQ